LYVILGLIALGIIIALAKHVLFNPRVNSVLSIIVFFFGFAYAGISWVLYAIVVFDCILDIVNAKRYYEDISDEIDKLYLTKSLTSLVTLGIARIVFLLIVNPILSHSVKSDIKKRLTANHPLPYESEYSNLKKKNYYYSKQIRKIYKNGVIVSNIETVDTEARISRIKLNNSYPEKLIGKLVDMVAGDKEVKRNREVAEQWLRQSSLQEQYAYINSQLFNQYPILITDAMAKRGCLSPRDMRDFEELEPLNLTLSLGSGAGWSEYFIIQALSPLVADEEYEDNSFSDNPLENHQYRYSKSSKNMPSIDADNDPLFALD
jgi:hypothetical protein